jgi:preprotein translocase subunit SecY
LFNVATILSIVDLGIQPLLSAFVFVECVALLIPKFRPMRINGHFPRKNLVFASLILGLAFAALQAFFISVHLESSFVFHNAPPIVPDPGWSFRIVAITTLTAGVFLLSGLCLLISRYGIGNGFSVLIAAGMAGKLADTLFRFYTQMRIGTLSNAESVSWVAALAGTACIASLLAKRGRSPNASPVNNHDSLVVLPTCGVIPLKWAAAFLLFPKSLGPLDGLVRAIPGGPHLLDVLAEWLPESGYLLMTTELTFVALFGIALSFLFYRPNLVASFLSSLSPESSSLAPPGAPPDIQSILLKKAGISIAFLAGVTTIQYFIPISGLGLNLIEVVILAFVVVDLREESRAWKRHPSLVKVWELHRLYAVSPVRQALEDKGIPFHLRGLGFRSLFYFFAPYVPVEVLVPKENAEMAEDTILDALQFED